MGTNTQRFDDPANYKSSDGKDQGTPDPQQASFMADRTI